MSKKIMIVVLGTILIAALGLAACTGTPVASAANADHQSGGGYSKGGGQTGDSEAAAQGQGQGRGGQGGGRGQGQGQGRGQGQGQGGYALEPLSEAEADALLRAIEEEYGAQALYQSVLDTFGDVEPFSMIVQSEAQHAAALVRQAEKYGLTVPKYPGTEGLPVFETLAQACQAGVEAEIADAALYDELMPLTTHADILRVYENLKNASLNSHLPAFETCQ